MAITEYFMEKPLVSHNLIKNCLLFAPTLNHFFHVFGLGKSLMPLTLNERAIFLSIFYWDSKKIERKIENWLREQRGTDSTFIIRDKGTVKSWVIEYSDAVELARNA